MPGGIAIFFSFILIKMAVEKQGYRAALATSCFAAAPTQPSASSAGNVQNLTSRDVRHTSVPHPRAQFPSLIPFRFYLFGLIRSFQWDKRDPYFEHNKLPHSLSQDLCPYVLNSCCPSGNANGSEILWWWLHSLDPSIWDSGSSTQLQCHCRHASCQQEVPSQQGWNRSELWAPNQRILWTPAPPWCVLSSPKSSVFL